MIEKHWDRSPEEWTPGTQEIREETETDTGLREVRWKRGMSERERDRERERERERVEDHSREQCVSRVQDLSSISLHSSPDPSSPRLLLLLPFPLSL